MHEGVRLKQILKKDSVKIYTRHLRCGSVASFYEYLIRFFCESSGFLALLDNKKMPKEIV